jgi:hypothetical protein
VVAEVAIQLGLRVGVEANAVVAGVAALEGDTPKASRREHFRNVRVAHVALVRVDLLGIDGC